MTLRERLDTQLDSNPVMGGVVGAALGALYGAQVQGGAPAKLLSAARGALMTGAGGAAVGGLHDVIERVNPGKRITDAILGNRDGVMQKRAAVGSLVGAVRTRKNKDK